MAKVTHDQIRFELDKYTCYVEYSHTQAMDPEIDCIWFEPGMDPDDVRFCQDAIIRENDTMATVIAKYYHKIKICGLYLHEEIEKRL